MQKKKENWGGVIQTTTFLYKKIKDFFLFFSQIAASVRLLFKQTFNAYKHPQLPHVEAKQING